MLKKIACYGLVAFSLLAVMTDPADARLLRRRSRGCNTCQPCNSCHVPQGQYGPQGQYDPNAPMIDPNMQGPAPQPAPVQPAAPQPFRNNNAA